MPCSRSTLSAAPLTISSMSSRRRRSRSAALLAARSRMRFALAIRLSPLPTTALPLFLRQLARTGLRQLALLEQADLVGVHVRRGVAAQQIVHRRVTFGRLLERLDRPTRHVLVLLCHHRSPPRLGNRSIDAPAPCWNCRSFLP